ncbi:MAG: PBSX family phage terminase large subunit [Ruminococcus sp.]|nr:PBSX family phage terminase large subunit [Ruminococcus sp.]
MTTAERIPPFNEPGYSDKQLLVMNWWRDSGYKAFDAILCDGAVRSGKSVAMSHSFLLWAMSTFNKMSFGICSKTISSAKRNVIPCMTEFAKHIGMHITLKQTQNYFDCRIGVIENRFYIFGGKDESAAALIQGITLAGVLIDEAALLPRSFIEQAVARCSVAGSKIWLNCNPESKYHWLKKEWIDKKDEKNLLCLTFTLDDNPTLTSDIKKRYHRLYNGAFYERYVLGKWTAVQGLVYPVFDEDKCCFDKPPDGIERFAMSCDYGTVNPTSIGLWGESEGIWYRLGEYYYDSKKEGERRTDEEHYKALCELAGDREIEKIIIDPSASSFIECIRRHGKYRVKAARNDVTAGIGRVTYALSSGRIKISKLCTDTRREFTLYRWEENGKDIPVKENDHAMDDIRYFVSEYAQQKEDAFFVMAMER